MRTTVQSTLVRILASMALQAALIACSSGGGTTDASGDGGDTASDAAGEASSDAFVPAPHPAYPQVTSSPDGTFTTVTLVSIVSQNDALSGYLMGFADALRASHWWPTTTMEYGIGAITRSVSIMGPPITANISDMEIVTYIQNAVSAAGAPQPDGTLVYLLFLPDGVDEVEGTQVNTGCRLHRGFHAPLNTTGIDSYAVVQRCPLEPGQNTMDVLTEVASHEVLEAATDPTNAGYSLAADPMMPWSSDAWNSFVGPLGAELGDLCHDTRIREGTYSYQRSWSNMAAALGGDPCVPALSEPYYSASPMQSWSMVSAGGSVDVPIVAWSTGARDDWLVRLRVVYQSTGATFNVTQSSPRMQSANGFSYALVNNGETVTAHVAATSARSGSYAVFWIESTLAMPTGDTYHLWPFGVYVP